jgi:glycosyltransferase involved in cell wall biosynthesis
MKVSVCITVFNEAATISKLLNSLFRQSKVPDEIVIVDGGSKDETVKLIKNYIKRHRNIKLFVKKCSRAEGRNIAVKTAKYDYIAMTDAGCWANSKWLERITKPFSKRGTEMVAGFYKMVGNTYFQKALSVYLGVTPTKFDNIFLPSTRSVAFKRKLWDRVGGFPENLPDTAEDTVFNYKAVKLGTNITRVKNAVVYWKMPKNLRVAANKFYSYAKGDAKTGIWKKPSKMYTSHNVKVLLIYLRYLMGLLLLLLSLVHPPLLLLTLLAILIYSFRAFNKVCKYSGNIYSGLWGIIIQYVSDISVMAGFAKGIFG